MSEYEKILEDLINNFTKEVIEHYNGEIEPVKRSLLNIISTLEREKFLFSLGQNERDALMKVWTMLSDESLEKLSLIFAAIADNNIQKELNLYGIRDSLNTTSLFE